MSLKKLFINFNLHTITCGAGEGGQERIWEIWCEMEENIKFYFSRQCLRRDTCPNQILMGSSGNEP